MSPDEDLMHKVACCVYEYIFTGQPSSVGGPKAESLVQLGFARFRDTEFGVVDEPLALLAAANFFSENTSWTMQTVLSAGLLSLNPGERGFTFERFCAFLLAKAFESPTSLSSVFTFIGPNKLDGETARLVAIEKDGDDSCRCTPVTISASARRHYILGQSPSSDRQVLDWLENPKGTALCFPAKSIGPDLILFLQLSDSTVLRVLIQFKQITQRTISPAQTEDAMRTTDPMSFFTRHARISGTDEVE
jgi:hypothetical protein